MLMNRMNEDQTDHSSWIEIKVQNDYPVVKRWSKSEPLLNELD